MRTDDADTDTTTAEPPEQPAAVVPRQANPFGTAVVAQETAGLRQAQSREMAETQTKFLMAQHFPRDERKAMDGILNAFARTTLAERAQYAFQRGGQDISGLSIDAMEAIAQQWQNIEFGWAELSRGVGLDGVSYSDVRSYAIDLQSRVPRYLQFIVRHWRDTKKGGYKLTDERDIYELCANMAQRRVRSCLEAVIPRDVQESAREQANVTLKSSADTSEEGIAKMLRVFGKLGVTKDQIEQFIGRRVEAIQPAQVVRLVRVAQSIRDGLSTADEWFEPAAPAAGGEPTGEVAAPAAAPARTSAADKAKEALRQRQQNAGATTKAAAAVPSAAVAQFKTAVDEAPDADAAALILDQARDSLDATDNAALAEHFRKAWGKE